MYIYIKSTTISKTLASYLAKQLYTTHLIANSLHVYICAKG